MSDILASVSTDPNTQSAIVAFITSLLAHLGIHIGKKVPLPTLNIAAAAKALVAQPEAAVAQAVTNVEQAAAQVTRSATTVVNTTAAAVSTAVATATNTKP